MTANDRIEGGPPAAYVSMTDVADVLDAVIEPVREKERADGH